MSLVYASRKKKRTERTHLKMNTMIRIPMMELTGLYRVLARKKRIGIGIPLLKKTSLGKKDFSYSWLVVIVQIEDMAQRVRA